MPEIRLSPDELRTLLACAETGSFSAASRRVHRTQSTVSAQVARIEAEVGAPVFERRPRGVVPTERGELLIGYARRLLALQHEMTDALSGLQPAGRLRLGLSEYVLAARAADAVRRLAQRFPRLSLSARVAQTAELERQLAAGELDLVLGTTLNRTPPSAGRMLGSEPLAWIASAPLRFAPRTEVPLVLLDPSCAVHRHACHTLARAGLRPRVAFVASGVLGVHAAVAAGLGVGLLNRAAIPPDLHRLGAASGLPDAGRLHTCVLQRTGDASARPSPAVVAALVGAF